MAVKHAKVDVVTIGAGWTAAMLAAKLCPHGTSMVSLEQGDARWTYPHFAHDHDSLRYSVRYAMMVDLQREIVDVAAEPESAGAADAAVRQLQPRARASAARRCTGRASSGATRRRTSAIAPT